MTIRRLGLTVPVLAILVLVVAGAAWYFLIRSDASPLTEPLAIDPSLVNTATPTGGASDDTSTPAASDGQVFTILAGQSEADYYVGETLASLGVPSTANGKTQDISGTFYLTADGAALDTSQTSQFTVDLTTLRSDQSRRDSRAQDALNTTEFPTATFTASSISGLDTASIADGAEVTFDLNGTLDLHGVQKEMTWTVKATRQSNVISAIATLDFNFADYGISPPNIGGFVSVQDHGTLQAVIIAQQQ